MTRPNSAGPARLVAIALTATAAAWLAGCSSNNNAKPAAATATRGPIATLAATGTNSPASGAAQAVDIKNTSFPATINVKPGATVTWTNRDGFQHTVTSDAGQAQRFDSKPIDSMGSFSVTFAKAGTYTYHCEIHSSMHGTVVVGDGAAGVSTPGSAPGTAAPRYPY